MRRRLVPVLLVLALASACSSSGSKSASSSGATSSSTTASSSSGKRATKGDVDQTAGDPSKAGYTPTGPLVADNGFRPEKDGFSFENYGKVPDGQPPRLNMTPVEMRKLFGDTVCEDPAASTCNLSPQAQQWMESANKGTEGGHCQGFSVLSGMLWQKQEKASDFGADTTPQLKIDGNEALQREIAYAFNFQVLDAYNNAIVKGTPNDILAKLIEVLKPDATESYTIGIYKRGPSAGHAVTPYAVEDAGNGIFMVLIYDNNFPGVTRAIKIDKNANTWSYVAATNPQNPAELYEGDADSKTIDLEPTTPGRGVQPCPFCAKRSDDAASVKGAAKGSAPSAGTSTDNVDASSLDWIYLDASDVDHGHLLITDESGHRLGYAADGTFVSEIPGAHASFPKSNQTWSAAPEPDYYVPDGYKYSITLDGTGLEEADYSAIGILGPGFDLYVDNIDLQKGEKDSLVVTPDAEQVTFSPSMEQTPSVELAFNEDIDYTITLSGGPVAAGKTLDLQLPVGAGALTVAGAPGGTYDVNVEREDNDEDATFTHKGVTIADGDTVALQYAAWTAKADPMNLDVTHAGSTSTTALDNQS